MIEQRRFESLGGSCELYAIRSPIGRLDDAVAWTQGMHDRLTRFSDTSELSRFNAARGKWVNVSPELEALLRQCLVAFERSDGLVHAGILPALMRAGYTRDFGLGPTPAYDDAVPPAPLPELLEVAPGRARLALDAAIDLGGIAKGWLADRLCERIGDNCIANLAGDLFARGGGEDGEGWPIGFGGKTLLLRDMGAATSGVSKRAWGDGLHHLIDPRTARPARTDVREASVLAKTAADAEVLAKAALLLGRDAAERWLEGRSPGWWLGG